MEIDNLRLTAWLIPEFVTSGKYGNVTNQRWIELEKERFEAQGKEVVIVERTRKVAKNRMAYSESNTELMEENLISLCEVIKEIPTANNLIDQLEKQYS